MKMKLMITILLLLSGKIYAQEKYTLTSILTLDSLGNAYQVNKTYDHIPTSKDSADFLKESRISIHKMIDSFYNTNIEKAKFIKTKQKKKKNKSAPKNSSKYTIRKTKKQL